MDNLKTQHHKLQKQIDKWIIEQEGTVEVLFSQIEKSKCTVSTISAVRAYDAALDKLSEVEKLYYQMQDAYDLIEKIEFSLKSIEKIHAQVEFKIQKMNS